MCYEVVELAPYVTGLVHKDIKRFLLNPSEPTQAKHTVTAKQYAFNYNLGKQISKIGQNQLKQDLKIDIGGDSIMCVQD